MSKFYSDTLEEGIRILYFQKDENKYPSGVEKIKQAVDDGEADACYFLTRCYAWGDGNVAEDMHLARKFSKQGIAAGSDLCVLGAERFDGLVGDIEAAMHGTLEDAFNGAVRQAEAGNPMAQYAVALFYYWEDISILQQPNSPEEFTKNEKKNALMALKWYKLAAQQGCIPAFRNHYACLAHGSNGAAHDLKAAMQFVEEVKDRVDIPMHFYSEFAGRYEQLDQFKSRLRWLEDGMAKGDCDCCNELGQMYLNGDGFKKDQSKGVEFFRKAEAMGDMYAVHYIARCYYDGTGVKEDNDEAFRMFCRAAKGGVVDAQRMMASCYYYGYGTDVDYKKCFECATEAASKGSTAATYFVGKCYLYGQGVEQNAEKAKHNLEINAEHGSAGANFLIGEMYNKALGVPEDIDTAIIYYQKAIEGGNSEAEEALAHFKKSMLGKRKRR